MEFYSCDTMVALGNSTRSGNILFAKNSDRPMNEAQPLVLFEAADHAPGEELKCTYITIPQVEHTYRVMGSQPYWLWGFEHGMNEHKVVIGNEAVWSKEEEETENGLLGMDLLRLAWSAEKQRMKPCTSLFLCWKNTARAAVRLWAKCSVITMRS